MTLAAFYVLISRVRTLNSLRLLQDDPDGQRSLHSLKHDEFLAAWERGALSRNPPLNVAHA